MKRGLILLLLAIAPLLYDGGCERTTAESLTGNVPASLWQGDGQTTAAPDAPLFAMPGSSSNLQLSEAGTQSGKTRLPVLSLEQTAYHAARLRLYRSARLRGTPRSGGYIMGRPSDSFLYPYGKIVI